MNTITITLDERSYLEKQLNKYQSELRVQDTKLGMCASNKFNALIISDKEDALFWCNQEIITLSVMEGLRKSIKSIEKEMKTKNINESNKRNVLRKAN